MHAPKLARYEVLGRLATGGMAEVWLARSLGIAGFEKLVVLKTILPTLAQSPQFVAMFVNEARLAAMLSHPNCVQIFDLGQEGDWLYIAMEYLEGFSLARVLKRAKVKGVTLSERIVARIIMDAASGLDYSHRLKDREGRALGIVHRDVSPDNLLVGFSGQVKLVDFGIAKAATPALMAAATTAGTVKGKHGYIAPEYLLGRPLDGRADVFALGVVLYRALTGKRPFLGQTEAAISMAVVSDPPRPPLEVMPSLNPALAAVALMALEKEPVDRFESARAMRQAIEVAVGHAAENEEVADLVNELWPPGDEERVALHTLSSGLSEESSSPALRSVVSGTYASMATAHVEQRTREIVRPPGLSVPVMVVPPTFDTAEQQVFEQPAASRRWLVAVAVVSVVLVAGLGLLFKGRRTRPAHLSVVTPRLVKVFEGTQELGSSPLEVELTSGSHTLRLSNEALGINQTVVIHCEAGQTCSVSELADAR